MPKLGVNIDHVATLRQARGEYDPDPIVAARCCEKAGAEGIVAHLREDRRHIQDEDIRALRESITTRLNLEMSLDDKIVAIACSLHPDVATIVPEKRAEITTEGGLDVVKHFRRIKLAAAALKKAGIKVSLFIDPVAAQIVGTKEAGVNIVELHTGAYANAKTSRQIARELDKIRTMTSFARKMELTVNAGHGLKYDNVRRIARIPGIAELNIGHSIIARAVFVGLEQAVREMAKIVNG
ncbi:MAG TPA: pyridoxine 5'-phosphate synthase [Candidatus Omnitrophica bacterium]|nr:pyridoxine 5'-phosphate synthase [Candidatus Omnitrophota bacterium]HCI43959.1 pyridoxine 5'-phosphate synthase [Candidatus Omnitrophota bacterium]